jgi:hypothetical protein
LFRYVIKREASHFISIAKSYPSTIFQHTVEPEELSQFNKIEFLSVKLQIKNLEKEPFPQKGFSICSFSQQKACNTPVSI